MIEILGFNIFIENYETQYHGYKNMKHYFIFYKKNNSIYIYKLENVYGETENQELSATWCYKYDTLYKGDKLKMQFIPHKEININSIDDFISYSFDGDNRNIPQGFGKIKKDYLSNFENTYIK